MHSTGTPLFTPSPPPPPTPHTRDCSPLQAYGAQVVVVSVDPRRVYIQDPASVKHQTTKVAKKGPQGETYVWWQCTVNGGREGRNIGAVELSQAVEQLGAGEILLNCIDNDGQVPLLDQIPSSYNTGQEA